MNPCNIHLGIYPVFGSEIITNAKKSEAKNSSRGNEKTDQKQGKVQQEQDKRFRRKK